jgi:hypothetical protein
MHTQKARRTAAYFIIEHLSGRLDGRTHIAVSKAAGANFQCVAGEEEEFGAGEKGSGYHAAWLHVLADERYYLVHGRARVEDPSDAGLLHEFEVLFRNNPADQQ